MSQVKKLQSGGKPLGKLIIDSTEMDATPEMLEQLDLNISTFDPSQRRFAGEVTDALRRGETVTINSHSNNITSNIDWSRTLGNRGLKQASSGRTTAGKVLGTLFNTNVNQFNDMISNLARFRYVPKSADEAKELQTIDNSRKSFEYGPDGYAKDSITNGALKNRMRYYYDYLSENDIWNKAYKWSDAIDDGTLKGWYEGLGVDNQSRRNRMEEIVNAALAKAESANSWDDVDENTRRILSYFNIGNPDESLSDEEKAKRETAKLKEKWKNAGYTDDKLYDLIGEDFELNDAGQLQLKSGHTFNLGNWHNGKNIYFNDDFYNSEYGVSGDYNPLRGLTYYNGKFYNNSSTDLRNILNAEGGYNDLIRKGNWNGADDIILTRFTPGAKANFGRLQDDKYSKFLFDNPSYRFQNVTGILDTENGLNGNQLIQYIDLTNPIDNASDPYLNYQAKYAILDQNGNLIQDDYTGNLIKTGNEEANEFLAYNRAIAPDSPYNGMYYGKDVDGQGNEIPIRIYRDPKNPNKNVILHMPNVNAAGVSGDLALPENVAKIVLSNKTLIDNLSTNSQNMANFQKIMSKLVQSKTRAHARQWWRALLGPGYHILDVILTPSERKQLEQMGFSKEQAKELLKELYSENASSDRFTRQGKTMRYMPVNKMGGKIDYISRLAKGGVAGGTTKAEHKPTKHNVQLKNPGNAASLGDIGNNNWTQADTADLIALGADLASAGVILADPTNIAGAATGAAASLARFKADTLRHQANPEAGKGAGWNLALNLGMDAVSLLPVVGDAAKMATTASKIRKSLPTILKLISLAGMGDAAMTAAKKIANGEKWTVRDLSLVANAVTSGIALSRMGGFGKSTKTKTTKGFEAQKLKVGDKEIELSGDTIGGIAKKSTGEQADALKKAIKAKATNATDEQVTAAAEGLLKNKKSLWQRVRGKDGKDVLDAEKTKSTTTEEIEANGNWLHDWWYGIGTQRAGFGNRAVDANRAAYIARLRGEKGPTTQVESTVWKPFRMKRTDKFVDFNNARRVREKGSIKFEEIPEAEFNGRMFQEDIGAVNGGRGIAKYIGIRKRPIKTTTDVLIPNQLRPMAPHILAPFHSRTDYTYAPLPDLTYKPQEIEPDPNLMYVPMQKKGGVIKALGGYKIDPITGKPVVEDPFKTAGNFRITIPTYTVPGTTPSWSGIDITKPNTAATISAISTTNTAGNDDSKPVGERNLNIGNIGKAILPGMSLIRNIKLNRDRSKVYKAKADAVNAGRVSRDYIHNPMVSTSSTALQQGANQINAQAMNGMPAITSDGMQYTAGILTQQQQLNAARANNIAQQSQYEQQANLQNMQTKANEMQTNNQIAFENKVRDASINSALAQLRAQEGIEKAASTQNYLYELQSNLKNDLDYADQYAAAQQRAKSNQDFEEWLGRISPKDWNDWNSLADQSDYAGFEDYLSKKNPSLYKSNKGAIDDYKIRMNDNLILSIGKAKLNYPWLRGIYGNITTDSGYNFRKGGTLRGSTRYTLEPDERIWIDNNRAAQKAAAKLSDNVIKLLLRALK